MKQVAVAIGVFAGVVVLLALWLGLTGGPESVSDWAMIALLLGVTVASSVFVLGEIGRNGASGNRDAF